ncbi:hypothetical protein F5884DRAFT_758274 [Xylogone sp. PMI_703]|nr:hypothetical protein F5884DRAFT_758274 [Xylogone sp. PMI_703]
MAEAFITAVRGFSSDNSYKLIESLVEESLVLKMRLGAKTKEADDLKNEMTSLKRYEDRLQENLELYRKQRNELSRENDQLEKEIHTLNTIIQEKDATMTELSRILDGVPTQLTQFVEWLDEEKEKLRVANTGIEALQQIVTDKDKQIESLEQELRNQQVISNNRLQHPQHEDQCPQEELKVERPVASVTGNSEGNSSHPLAPSRTHSADSNDSWAVEGEPEL